MRVPLLPGQRKAAEYTRITLARLLAARVLQTQRLMVDMDAIDQSTWQTYLDDVEKLQALELEDAEIWQ